MDWIRQNRFLSGYLAVVIVGVLGLGFWVFKGWGAFKEAREKWETDNNRLTSLERKQLYPNNENLEEKKRQVQSFAKAVGELQDTLTSGQRELKPTLNEQQFREILNGSKEAVAAVAAQSKLKIPEDFFLGFEAYTQGKAINPLAIPLLEWKVDAIKQFVALAAESGVAELISVERVEFAKEDRGWAPEEEGGSKPKSSKTSGKGSRQAKAPSGDNPLATADKVMETYRFTARVRGSYPSIQALLNAVSNDETFFFWIRDLRIENNVKTSPRRADIPPPAPVPDALPDDSGQVPMVDASILFGNEEVYARLVVDAVRFKAPAPDAAPENN